MHAAGAAIMTIRVKQFEAKCRVVRLATHKFQYTVSGSSPVKLIQRFKVVSSW